ncbi:uncharacterized protein DNG_04893 [Cephalotrichum gorgonifer]|uniref:MADS-box MEF2 type transcription factor MIG1 n=1 Tax=Cephalotrichum gorgonifer TaxID=2041049 RepID=A0AAE8SV03_9PEZI|nr:uncharacterized protein DNG_04893 [Cephalotrichum gorgonifer]
MGRRKIEIKAIKDDRNRSVTFLKRKGGLFKKAHELSVLCSVDVAVFIFGNNKKLYEYSSADMHELITRHAYHGGPNEHKGPIDFSGGNDDEDSAEEGTPPQRDSMDPQMMPPQFQGQPPYAHMAKHAPSASPPMPNGVPFHPGYAAQRGHTPQPQMGSRPSSRNDGRRMGPNMMPQPGPQPPVVNGYASSSNNILNILIPRLRLSRKQPHLKVIPSYHRSMLRTNTAPPCRRIIRPKVLTKVPPSNLRYLVRNRPLESTHSSYHNSRLFLTCPRHLRTPNNT